MRNAQPGEWGCAFCLLVVFEVVVRILRQAQDEGVLSQDEGMLPRDAGVLSQDEGVLSQD